MTKMNEILIAVPGVLSKLTGILHHANEEFPKDPQSRMAYLFLAIRSGSLLCGMGKLLTPETLDSFEVMTRGYLEARDLLMTFRFDDLGTKKKIGYWFEGEG